MSKKEYTIKDIYRAEGVGRTICQGHTSPSPETLDIIGGLKEDINHLKESDILNVEQHKQILDLLTPISETYKTVNMLGKWLMALLVFLSILAGVIWSWTNVIKGWGK